LKKKYKLFVQHFIKSELIRSASILVTGTVLAQLISILLQPFLRRFFSPESFGLFSVYLSIIGILLVITTLRYDDAIVLPDNDSESANLLVLSLIFSLAINFLLFIIVLTCGDRIFSLLNLPKKFSIKILYIIPFSVLLYNTYLSFNYWLIRKKRFLAVSSNKLIRRGTEGAAQVIFALIGYMKGLVFSDIIGQSSNVITVIIQSFKNGFRFKKVSLKKLKYVFHKYSEFPKYNLIPAFMSACSYLLPPIFITKNYSVEYSGFFVLSKLLLSIPLALIATAFSNVLLQKISEKYQKKQSFRSDLMPVFYIICLICLFEILIILLFGIILFKVVFGEIWGFSGEISKIMVWSFVLNFFVSTFSCIFISMRKIKIYSIWQTGYFVAILSLLFFKNLIFIDFLKIYVAIEVICYISLLALMFIILAKYELSIK
jgi:O-antigen/teichoic acid export membrane protein